MRIKVTMVAFALAVAVMLSGVNTAIASDKEFEIFMHDPGLPTVAVVTTGGTIAEKTDPKTGGAVPAVSGSDLVEAVPGLKKVANIGVLNFSNIDSSHMTPGMWADLSRTVN